MPLAAIRLPTSLARCCSFRGALDALRRVARWTYLTAYEQRCPGIRERALSWLPLVAAGRLSEGIAEEQAQLQAFVCRHLPP
jgi:hypothetical protein